MSRKKKYLNVEAVPSQSATPAQKSQTQNKSTQSLNPNNTTNKNKTKSNKNKKDNKVDNKSSAPSSENSPMNSQSTAETSKLPSHLHNLLKPENGSRKTLYKLPAQAQKKNNVNFEDEQERIFQTHLSLLTTSAENVDQTEIITTPIFSGPVLKKFREYFTQFGFLAGNSTILEQIKNDSSRREDPRLFFNISSPSSAFICGSQGSGKSHTLACLLENCLMKSDLSELNNPLAALVFHHDSFTPGSSSTPCEAAYLSSNPQIKVRVLCSPASVQSIQRTYDGFNVSIEPLNINQTDLNTKRMLDLMAVNVEDGPMPLYLHSINRILRELRIEQQDKETSFDYREFKSRVLRTKLTAAQFGPLNQRLDTLESFMLNSQTKLVSKASLKERSNGNNWAIKSGTLTIVDLSCPCVTPESACSLFNICLGLFLEQATQIGRIVALDEAHKYMNSSVEASTLTASLLTSIRIQRHIGARIFISTQEPTISPALLDLCSVTFVHRFTSPEWLHCLRQHIAALKQEKLLSESPTDKENTSQNQETDLEFLEKIVKLDVGEAFLFSPSAMVNEKKLGIGYLKIKVRDRLTDDGGKSIMAK